MLQELDVLEVAGGSETLGIFAHRNLKYSLKTLLALRTFIYQTLYSSTDLLYEII